MFRSPMLRPVAHSTGKERDSESGNDYFGARYYASSMGRFLSPDQGPWKLEDPQYFNMYGYALNNSLRFGDDEGETAQDRVNKANQLAAENIPYVTGGGHPGNPKENCGLDCSGLVHKVFASDPDNTLKVDGSAATEATQFQKGGDFSTDINDAQPGDAIFFKDDSGIVHAGIVVRVADGKVWFIHAPHPVPPSKVRPAFVPIKSGAFGAEKFVGVGRSHEGGNHTPASKGPSLLQSIESWLLSFFPDNGGSPNKDPEGKPERHTTVPCLMNRDGNCADQ